jgi:hypothetical protein
MSWRRFSFFVAICGIGTCQCFGHWQEKFNMQSIKGALENMASSPKTVFEESAVPTALQSAPVVFIGFFSVALGVGIARLLGKAASTLECRLAKRYQGMRRVLLPARRRQCLVSGL